jgi:hypothetical protein
VDAETHELIAGYALTRSTLDGLGRELSRRPRKPARLRALGGRRGDGDGDVGSEAARPDPRRGRAEPPTVVSSTAPPLRMVPVLGAVAAIAAVAAPALGIWG